MSLTWPGRLVVFFALLWMAAPASAQVVRLEQQDGAVAGIDAEGSKLWAIAHHAAVEGEDGPFLRFEPIIDGRRAYYAIRSDLLTVDLDAGKVLARNRFPGVIDAMGRDAQAFKLRIFARALTVDAPQATSAIEVRYRPGAPTPGSGLFEAPLILTASDEALAVAGVAREDELEALSAEQADRRMARLGAAAKRDPTNLFLPLYRARLAQLHRPAAPQQDEPATPGFEAVAQLTEAPWSDDLLATFLLIRYGEDALSRRVAERARQKMLARGILPERLNGVVLQNGLSGRLSESLRDSIERGDVERMDYLLGRIAEFFPRSQQSALTWRWVADWMDAQKHAELAQVWRGRAARASHAPLVALNADSARKADRAILLLGALWVALILVPLGIGLRASSQRTAKGWPLPDLNMWDAIGFFALILGCSVLPSIVQKNAAVSATMMSAPPEIFDASYDSPEVVDWLEGLASSPGQSAWLAYAQKAGDALRDGSRSHDAPPAEQLLADAIAVHAVAAGARADAAAPAVMTKLTRWGALSPGLLAPLIIVLLVVMLSLGMLMRRYVPHAARYLHMMIPASAKILSPLAVPICALLSAAILALFFDLDRRVRHAALPRSGAIFEHGELVDTYLTFPSTWIAVAAALLTLHALTRWGEQGEAASP